MHPDMPPGRKHFRRSRDAPTLVLQPDDDRLSKSYLQHSTAGRLVNYLDDACMLLDSQRKPIPALSFAFMSYSMALGSFLGLNVLRKTRIAREHGIGTFEVNAEEGQSKYGKQL